MYVLGVNLKVSAANELELFQSWIVTINKE